MAKITKRVVDATQPGDRDVFVWDGELRGFGLRVKTSGAKSYIVQYRTKTGHSRRTTLGRHGVLTPAKAREKALGILAAVADGEDPADENKHGKGASLKDVAEKYLAECDAKKRVSTAAEYRRVFDKTIWPKLGNRPFASIGQDHIADFHRELADRPYLANRVRAILSGLFTWAARNKYPVPQENPCRYVEKYREQNRERFLSAEELARLGKTLEDLEEEGEDPYIIAAIRLLIFTGARRGEILALRWQDVDFERRVLRLPDSKTGAKTVYLNPPALEVLASIERQHGNPHVICGRRHGAHLVNVEKPWRRIRERAGIPDVRVHDLRHSFASVAVAGGQSLAIIGRLLGHHETSTTAKYAHLSADPLRTANDAVGDSIAAALKGTREDVRKLSGA